MHHVKRRKLSPPTNDDNEAAQSAFYKQAAGWNLEQDYEQRPRKKKREKETSRLPIKTAEGRIEQLQSQEVERKEDPEDWFQEEKGEGEDLAPLPVETKIPIRQQIIEAKEALARLAHVINEDPEEHAGAFKALGSIAATKIPVVKKLALATQLAVYKDVIPGYRIRPISEENQTEKVSRDVRRLRAFEQSLVSSYQLYLRDLAACAKTSSAEGSEADHGIPTVAINCVCVLLLAVPHFNFRGELLKTLVGKLSGRKADGHFIKSRDTIVQFFRDDDEGGRSMDAVGLMTRMIKARNYQIQESVLNTFLHLRLLSEFSSKASQNSVDRTADDGETSGKPIKVKREFRTKKYRKVLKERKAVEKDFREADAIVNHEQRDRTQAETLKMVFVTYFRILKARIPHLTGAVLEGLAKYAHLINQDFFGDLLEALKDLIKEAEASLSPNPIDEEDGEENAGSDAGQKDVSRETLLCITTAFALLEGQDAARSASALNLDLTFFTSTLYKSLHSLGLSPDLELSSKTLRLADPDSNTASPTTTDAVGARINVKTTSALLFRALASILIPRTTPPVRLAAFTKQLYTTALHLPEKSTQASLGLINNIAKTHSQKIASLWNTDERKGDGVFDPWRGDFESSNPFASTVWEGELLRLHFSPDVRLGVKGVEKMMHSIR